MNSGVLDITNEERQRQVFLEALGGSDRIAAMVADDPLDPLYEFLKRETPPETSTIENVSSRRIKETLFLFIYQHLIGSAAKHR